MNYMSVCSGVEAASLAWKGLGWEPLAFSEIEKFPCAVLAERFPGVPNLGDMTKIEVTDDEIHGAGFTVCRRDVDLLVGGTPCQSFSVAGRREGLKGASGLAYHFVRLLREIQPKWFVWENVPGALSSRTDGQLDFNFLVGAFAECGYGLAWRILDAQYVRSKSFPFAIPQRRRRLFVVGCLGDGESAGKVLFDGESLSGDTPPRRIKMQGTSGCAERSLGVSIRTAHTRANGCGIGVGSAHTLGASDVDAVWWDGSDKGRYTDPHGRLAADARQVASPVRRAGHQEPEPHRLREPFAGLSCEGNGGRIPDAVMHEQRKPHAGAGCGADCVQQDGQADRGRRMSELQEYGVANTLNLWDMGESRANELVVGYPPVISLDGDKIGNSNDLMYTHTAKGVHGVAYGINCQASLMHPFSEEVSQVISVAHQSGVVRDECIPIDMRDATRDANKKDDVNRQGLGVGDDGAPSPTITANPCGVGWRGTVRRLLPVETERLMGFPDNWTRIPWRGKPAEQCPDGPRYKACGNSMCVNCMEWIGERIEKVDRELQEEGR